MTDTSAKPWRDFVHTIDVVLAQARAQDDQHEQIGPDRRVYTMPALAAASTGEISGQKDGPVPWDLVPAAGRPGQFYLLLQWHFGEPFPVRMVVVGADETERSVRSLNPDEFGTITIFDDGTIRLNLDTAIEGDARLVRLLTAPQSIKFFEC